MDSILKELNGNNGHKSVKDLRLFEALVDQQLNRTYVNTDCVDKYSDNYIKVRDNSGQYYQCGQDSCRFFTNKSSLIVRHIRRHLKDKPYLCPLDNCKKGFYQKCELRSHLLRHFDDKPFKCQIQSCDKTYTTRKALSLHIKSHQPFGYVCGKCNTGCATQWLLKKHMQIKHKQPLSNLSTAFQQMAKHKMPIHSKAETRTESEPKVKPKVQPKPIPKQFHDFIAMRGQLKERLVSQTNAFMNTFGLEEVNKYMAKRPDIQKNGEVFGQRLISDIMAKLETNAREERKRVDEKVFEKNKVFVNAINRIVSLIESSVYELEDSKRHFFKCFACSQCYETIDGIVGHTMKHVWDHLSVRLKGSDK